MTRPVQPLKSLVKPSPLAPDCRSRRVASRYAKTTIRASRFPNGRGKGTKGLSISRRRPGRHKAYYIDPMGRLLKG